MKPLGRSVPRFRRAQLLAGLRKSLPRRCTAAYLFGSYASGEAHAHSDVDLIVVAPTRRPFVERFRDFPSLVARYAPLDLIVYTPEEWKELEGAPNPLLAHVRARWVPVLSRKVSRARRALGAGSGRHGHSA